MRISKKSSTFARNFGVFTMRNLINHSNTIHMATQQQNPGTLYNALTAGSKIIGTIIADSDMRVDGTIEGDIQCSGKLVVGEKGLIKGTIVCQNAEVMGKVEGKIDVKNALALRATSVLTGEMKTNTLMVEPNALFNGTCEMGVKNQPTPTPTPTTAK